MAFGFPPTTRLELPLGRTQRTSYLDEAQAAFDRLGWRIVHATYNRLVASVPGAVTSRGEVFSVRVGEDMVMRSLWG